MGLELKEAVNREGMEKYRTQQQGAGTQPQKQEEATLQETDPLFHPDLGCAPQSPIVARNL